MTIKERIEKYLDLVNEQTRALRNLSIAQDECTAAQQAVEELQKQITGDSESINKTFVVGNKAIYVSDTGYQKILRVNNIA